jgi:multimeric flavodoxin WrbA
MHMKILGVNASPKGKESQTLRLVKAVLQGAETEGAETDIIDLYSLSIEYCTACGSCYSTGECPLIDDFSELFDRIIEADGIVLGSPNYIDSITAPLKAAFDRMADAIHCQRLSGKYGCSVCTAGGSGQDEVVKYMNHVLTTLGATVVGGVGVAIGRDLSAILPAEKEAFELGKRLAESIRGEHRYPEQERIHRGRREYFCQLVKQNRTRWAHEYDWWVQKGGIKEGE